MSFIDFIHKYESKNKRASKIKIQQILSFSSLIDVRIYLGDGRSKNDIGIVKLHPSKGTHWVSYKNENLLIVMVVLPLKKCLGLL